MPRKGTEDIDDVVLATKEPDEGPRTTTSAAATITTRSTITAAPGASHSRAR